MRASSVLLLLALALPACTNSPRAIGEKEQVLYLALGASDAYGIGAEPITNGYVYRIRDELDRRIARVDLVNLGIPGAEIERTQDSLRAFLQTGAKPDVVTVWVGANDIIAGRAVTDFEPALDAMLTQLRAKTSAFVAVADIPDLTQLPRFRRRPRVTVTRERIRLFNDAIIRQARRHGMPVVDLYSQPVEPSLVSDVDGFHPSNGGHARIAQLFLDVILPAIGLSQARLDVSGR